jgi:heme-degrading monooxygenase HmoA
MFIAMNRFKVAKGREAQFESIWRDRDSRLGEVPGFEAFKMLKGGEADDHTLYVSHSVWRDKSVFLDWTKSDAFRASHKGAGDHREVYLEAPVLETFEAVAGI